MRRLHVMVFGGCLVGTRIPGLDFDSRVFVVPVGPSGALGAPVGPIAMEREGGGCSIAPERGGRLLLLGLLLVPLKLGLESRARSPQGRSPHYLYLRP